nr:hypothetical protein CFP56_58166 [Quercus suber]
MRHLQRFDVTLLRQPNHRESLHSAVVAVAVELEVRTLIIASRPRQEGPAGADGQRLVYRKDDGWRWVALERLAGGTWSGDLFDVGFFAKLRDEGFGISEELLGGLGVCRWGAEARENRALGGIIHFWRRGMLKRGFRCLKWNAVGYFNRLGFKIVTTWFSSWSQADMCTGHGEAPNHESGDSHR